jgi:hypothetical protein
MKGLKILHTHYNEQMGLTICCGMIMKRLKMVEEEEDKDMKRNTVKTTKLGTLTGTGTWRYVLYMNYIKEQNIFSAMSYQRKLINTFFLYRCAFFGGGITSD